MAAIFASPNQVHTEIGIECARRGIHILVEKPVTDTLEAATRLIEAVHRSGILALVGHHRRHHDQVQKLRGLLGNRDIGALVGTSAIWAAYKPNAYFEIAPWRTQQGRGPVLITFIHEIDFVRFTGEIVAVSAVTSSDQRHFAVEDTAGAVLEFQNGAIGTFIISDSAVTPWTVEQGSARRSNSPSAARAAIASSAATARSNSPTCAVGPVARRAHVEPAGAVAAVVLDYDRRLCGAARSFPRRHRRLGRKPANRRGRRTHADRHTRRHRGGAA